MSSKAYKQFGTTDPGDVGRRVLHRRRELGITRDELAARSGVAVRYLEHLEEHPAAVASDSVLRLAHGLDTTAAALLGTGFEMPPGGGTAGAHPSLDELSGLECQRLLAAGGVGRVVFVSGRGPVAFPVNYRLDGDDIVFRTAPGSELAGAAGADAVSFEVDHIDDAMKQGWSVLMTGYLREVTDPAERAQLEQLAIEPWAGGQRSVYLRLVPAQMSGRRINAG